MDELKDNMLDLSSDEIRRLVRTLNLTEYQENYLVLELQEKKIFKVEEGIY